MGGGQLTPWSKGVFTGDGSEGIIKKKGKVNTDSVGVLVMMQASLIFVVK